MMDVSLSPFENGTCSEASEGNVSVHIQRFIACQMNLLMWLKVETSNLESFHEYMPPILGSAGLLRNHMHVHILLR